MVLTKSKADKIFECYNFLKQFQAFPKALIECRLRKKNRSQKLEQCMKLFRNFIHLEKNKINLQRCSNLNTLFHFDSILYDRSFHYIKSLSGSSDRSKTYVALMIDRKIQVYNFMTKQLLFEIKLEYAFFRLIASL